MIFRAHIDSELLVLTRSAYDGALQAHSKKSTSERAAFLRKCFPPEVTMDTIERLVPLFHEDSRPKGSVLVRAGCQTNSLWLIASGHCQSTVPHGTLASGVVAEATHGSHHIDNYESAHGVAVGGVASPGHAAHAAADADASGAEHTAPARSGGGSASTSIATRPTHISGVGNGHHAPSALGILEERQFVGMVSVFLHEPEPLTVSVTSPQVELLVLRADHCSKLTAKAMEALKEMTRARFEWHLNRSSHVATLPEQVMRRMARIRNEAQQAQIPHMIDSPFLRRQGEDKPGLAKLESVCAHFGGMVHPEAEWIFSPQNRGFFHQMKLICREEPVGHVAVGESDAVGAAATVAHPPQQKDGISVANKRFNTFHQLSRQLRHEAPKGSASFSGSQICPPAADSLAGQIGMPYPIKSVRPTADASPNTLSESFRENDARSSQKCWSLHDDEVPVELALPSRAFRETGTAMAPAERKVEAAEQARWKREAPRRVSPPRVFGNGPQGFKSRALQQRQAGLNPIGSPLVASGVESEPAAKKKQAGKLRSARKLQSRTPSSSPKALKGLPPLESAFSPPGEGLGVHMPVAPATANPDGKRRISWRRSRRCFEADTTLVLGSRNGSLLRGTRASTTSGQRPSAPWQHVPTGNRGGQDPLSAMRISSNFEEMPQKEQKASTRTRTSVEDEEEFPADPR